MRKILYAVAVMLVCTVLMPIKGFCAERNDNVNLLAALCIAEAGNQDDTGKKLVIDVVLNRMVSDEFPDTIEDVIYAPNAFSCVHDGGLEKAKSMYTEHEIKLVMDELCDEVDYDVVYFRTDRYADYGTPKLKHGDHYFSK